MPEHVHDAESEARYKRCQVLFQRELDAGVDLETIAHTATVNAGHAEAFGNVDRVEDFLLVATFARTRLEQQRADVERGRQISDALAADLGRRRELVEASHTVSEAMHGMTIGPSHETMQRIRHGEVTGAER